MNESTEPLAPLTDARVRELSNLARCGPDVVALAQEVARSRERIAAPDEPHDEEMARLFHETYERLAPAFGYETRKESAVPWEDVPENNRNLMISVCRTVVFTLGKVDTRDERIAALEAERDEALRVRDLTWEASNRGLDLKRAAEAKNARLAAARDTYRAALAAIALALGLPADAAPDAVLSKAKEMAESIERACGDAEAAGYYGVDLDSAMVCFRYALDLNVIRSIADILGVDPCAPDAVLAAVKAAAKDRERLDWLESEIVNVIDLDDGRLIDVKGDSVRAAIDATIEGAKR